MARKSGDTNRAPLAIGANPVTKGGDHKATYAADKRKGGWLVRVTGSHPDAFVGRTIPVNRRDGSEGAETLERIMWSGKDDESGDNVALYKFLAKPLNDEIPF